MANVSSALKPLWKAAKAGAESAAFYRGVLSVVAVADTFVEMSGWGKGMVWINGHALARFWSVGPQYTHYCPAGWLVQGNNELIIFETEGAPRANLTVGFMAEHLSVADVYVNFWGRSETGQQADVNMPI